LSHLENRFIINLIKTINHYQITHDDKDKDKEHTTMKFQIDIETSDIQDAAYESLGMKPESGPAAFIHELMCKVLHEGNEEAIQVAITYVTDIQSVKQYI
jgi:hypothetical protein